MSANQGPSAVEMLDAIEGKGFALTLEARGTSQKWITGKNLFMGIENRHGIAVRNAYGPVALEIPLRLGDKLNWTALDGSQVDSLSQALRNTVKRGLVRRGSHFYNAICMVAPLAL